MQQLPQIPGYRIIKKLGQGGMADVYLGVQENLARQVAIKVLIPSLFRDDQFSTRFIKEAQTAAHLAHPNIITIHDVNKLGDCYYIVMEYLEESLSQRMKKEGVIAPKDALDIIKMIASALDYAHRQGIIHRDIKPDNIMFRADGTVVLVDFGIARAMDAATQLTRTGMSIGTPHYMSPEQCRGEKIDGRSDFYSLGVELYELLTGNVPYNAENTAGIIIKHIQSPVPRLPVHLAYLQPLIDKMMAKDRNDRVANGKELIFFIDALMHTRSGKEKMPPMPPTDLELATVKLPPVELRKHTAPIGKNTTIEPRGGKPMLPILVLAGLIVVAAVTLYLLTRPPSPSAIPVQQEQEIVKPVETVETVAQGEPTTSGTPVIPDNHATTTNPANTKTNDSATHTPPVKEPPVKENPVKEQPIKEQPVKEQPVKEPPVVNTTADITPKRNPQADDREKFRKQLELDKQYNDYLQQSQEHVASGNYEKALEYLAEARKLKQTGQLAELEQSIRQARERKQRKIESAESVKLATLLDLDPELRKTYNNYLQRIQLEIPKIGAMFQVKGSITCSLAIDENGQVRVESLEENLEITPPRREQNVKGIITHKINTLTLAPPKNKNGQSVRITNWRVTFKVVKYMNTINLIKQ